MKPTAIYIGNPKAGDYIKQNVASDWEFLPHVKTIQEFLNGLDNGSITSDIDAIFVLDLLYATNNQQEKEEFATFVAEFSAYAFFGIINYMLEDKNPGFLDNMRQAIDSASYNLGDDANARYYIIKASNPLQDFDQAVSDFINNPPESAIESHAHISGEEVQEAQSIPAYDEDDDDAYDLQDNYNQYEETPSDKLGQVIAVTSSKGGSGKSTIAVSLATFLARSSINSVKEGLEQKPLKVIIVDFDVRDGQIGFITGNTKPSMARLAKIPSISERDIREVNIESAGLKCDLLLAPKRPRFANDIQTDFYVELINRLKRMYDYVILDTSVNYLDELLEEVAYPMADLIVFVTDIVTSSMFSMKRWIHEVTSPKEERGMGINKNKIGIVVNKNQQDIHMPPQRIQQVISGLPVISAVPNASKIIAQATNMSAMERVLENEGVYKAIRLIARAVVNNKYKLSDNVR